MNIRLKSMNDRLPAGNYEWTATIVVGGWPGDGTPGVMCAGTYASPPRGTLGDFLEWLAADIRRNNGVRVNITIRDYELRKLVAR